MDILAQMHALGHERIAAVGGLDRMWMAGRR